MSAACPLFGFIVQLRADNARDVGQLLSALRAEVLEPRSLLLTDGDGSNAYIITGDGFQATDADREAVVTWLAAQPLGRGCTIGALDDVGHAA